MVSVIIPVYNSEKTLSACVQSILNQTYSSFELVLIDDGSTDSSGQICDRIQDNCREKNIHCQVIHKSNGGVSSARNCGFEHASGEYFVCVDSDDVVEPCYLEDLVRTAEEHPELGHIICGFRCTSHEHNYIMANQEPLTITNRRAYMHLFDKILVQSPCLALYRTQIVRTNSIRMREELCLGEDLLFNLDYLNALGDAKIGVINKTNYIYQDSNQSSLNHRFREDLYDIKKEIIRTIAFYLEEWEISDAESWEKYNNNVVYCYQSILANTLSKQNHMPTREKISFNNMILLQEDFRQALDKGTISILPALKRAYLSGDYRRVLAVERIQKMKEVILLTIKKRGKDND